MIAVGDSLGGRPQHSLRERIFFSGLGSLLALVLIAAGHPEFQPLVEGLANSFWMLFWIFLVVVVWTSMVSLAVRRQHLEMDGYFISGFGGISIPYMLLDALVQWTE